MFKVGDIVRRNNTELHIGNYTVPGTYYKVISSELPATYITVHHRDGKFPLHMIHNGNYYSYKFVLVARKINSRVGLLIMSTEE